MDPGRKFFFIPEFLKFTSQSIAMNPYHNRPYLKDTRRLLRANLTTAEAVLWKYIKSRQLEGRKFRRQHSIENYIVDFYCASERLVIELDGSVHDNPGQANADFVRDQRLRELGFCVLRIDNDSVMERPDDVLDQIRERLQTTP